MAGLLTVGDIARHFGLDIHKVNYAIKSRSIIPQGRVGGKRVFDETARDRIGEVIAEIDGKQSRKPTCVL